MMADLDYEIGDGLDYELGDELVWIEKAELDAMGALLCQAFNALNRVASWLAAHPDEQTRWNTAMAFGPEVSQAMDGIEEWHDRRVADGRPT